MRDPTPPAFGAAEIARHRAERPEGIAILADPAGAAPQLVTWAAFEDAILDLAARIAARPGFAPGMRIGWIGPNAPGMLALLFACARLGVALVPLNWRLSIEELRWIEEDAGLALLVAGDAAHPFAVDFRARRPGDGLAPGGADAARLAGAPGPAAPLLIGYTSGTTGRPKGAVLTQAAFAANAANARALFDLTAADRVLTVLPMFHVGGLNIQTVPALLEGAQVLLPPGFDAEGVFDACAAHRPTLTLLVPAVMRALVAHPRWAAADLSSLRAVGAGSSEIPSALIEAFCARGIPVQQVYGATETCPIAIAQTRAEALAAPASIGRAAPLCEARIQDAEGRVLPAGAEGEIAVRGPNVMAGYWNAPEATAEALTDGWFRTGDVGRMDGQGRFWFTDRLKHVIISGGENIYPAEVERVLLTAPGVAEGAVCARADARWGEVPVAVVVPGSGFDRDAVLRHFAGRLARFKQPRDVVAAPALPRTALGKVQLAALRALASAPPRGKAQD